MSSNNTLELVSAPGFRRRAKILVAKIGLDGHDRGAKVIARALKEYGFEVVYIGIRQTPEMIAKAAVQEDVDIVGISIHSGAHMVLIPELLEHLKRLNAEDIKVIVGGIIPWEDAEKLKSLGVAEVFTPDTPIETIVEKINNILSSSKRR
jgi:methylmalonyl-CoA mutase C-terminal domain/subunit